ncbi:unnamed protein product [Rotaria sp. Silwood2]|nr:unnamed protein product [Rotaria sp. Silwood2]CAF3006799.1 unnamed protein product [Rotaria sp. Silwood2]CAF3370597.1 unnamed protein product [Rotaria sp. Silwood2]CAF4120085.1 unnamed protein product [Rotaria sp. Silwood2]CAF4172242.1 unnamed protein product [Rotaria sp. Silwood2]
MVQKRQLSNDENLICITYHDEKLLVHHRDQLQSRLEEIFHYSRIFTDLIEFCTYIKDKFHGYRLVFIFCGNLAQHLCSVVKSRIIDSENFFLYELQFGQERLLSNLPNGQRFQNIDQLFEKIIYDLGGSMENQHDPNQEIPPNDELNLQQSTLTFDIYSRFQQQKPFYSLSRESRRFILFQSFIEILLKIEKTQHDLEEMWAACCREANIENNDIYIKEIQDFQQKYIPNDAIRFYSKNSFLFRYINFALRCESIEKIFTFRPFIAHLHQQLVKLGSQQRSTRQRSEYTFYRGVKLPKQILQRLSDNKDNLISMNGFLSTTKSKTVADMYADPDNPVLGYESVRFEMHLDENQLNEIIITKRPYADISNNSDYRDEDEVLFFMGFIWYIKSVEQTSENLWKVELELSKDLHVYMNSHFDESINNYDYVALGKISHELGEYTSAINFFKRMLRLSPNLSQYDRAKIYLHIAKSEYANNAYENAIENLQKANENICNVSISNDETNFPLRPNYADDAELSTISMLKNMGLVYRQINNYEKAKVSFEEGLRQSLSNTDKAELHYALGELEFEFNRSVIANNHYHLALELAEEPSLKEKINRKLTHV